MKQEKSYIIHNGKNIKYIINYKDVKNLSVKIKDVIYITSPYFVRKEEIINFLYLNINKIESILEKKNNNKYYNPKKNIIRMMGDDYKIICSVGSSKSTWNVSDNKIFLKLKKEEDKETVLKKVLKKYSENYILERMNEISDMTKIKFNSTKIKYMKTKWGYCDKYNNIVISSQTIILDKEMIDYIIIHELCHTIEHNHSNNFWQLVGKFYPDYKIIQKKIKQVSLIN